MGPAIANPPCSVSTKCYCYIQLLAGQNAAHHRPLVTLCPLIVKCQCPCISVPHKFSPQHHTVFLVHSSMNRCIRSAATWYYRTPISRHDSTQQQAANTLRIDSTAKLGPSHCHNRPCFWPQNPTATPPHTPQSPPTTSCPLAMCAHTQPPPALIPLGTHLTTQPTGTSANWLRNLFVPLLLPHLLSPPSTCLPHPMGASNSEGCSS